MPDGGRIFAQRLVARRHERSRPAPLAGGDLLHGPPRSYRAVLLQNRLAILAFELVAVLDQEQVGALAALAVVAHADQNPAALQLAAGERVLEIALAQRRIEVAIALGHPEAP